MNKYRQAMQHCEPPAELESRMAARLQAAAPPVKQKVIRPWTFAKRLCLTAVLLVMLTVTVAAAVLVDWDPIFSDRFGEDAAEHPAAASAFQSVDASSVCGDVTLTVREALGDNKTIYLILEYRIPDSVDRELVQTALASEDPMDYMIVSAQYYATGDISWEQFQAYGAEVWAEVDWTDYESVSGYRQSESPLTAYAFRGDGSSSVAGRGYDPETGTLTYLLQFTTESAADLTAQPLTLEVFPPAVTVEGETIALAAHPALITFQPSYTARTKSGQAKTADGTMVEVTISPFSLSVAYFGTSYTDAKSLRQDTVLVWKDGTTASAAKLTQGYGGGSSGSADSGQFRSVSFEGQFGNIQDIRSLQTVMVGELSVSLSEDKIQ